MQCVRAARSPAVSTSGRALNVVLLACASLVLQSAMQLHLVTRSRFFLEQGLCLSVAAQTPSHIAATPTLWDEVHLQIPSILGLEGAHEDCGTLLLLLLVVALVNEHETCSMLPSHRTADAEGSPGCQSSFPCIVPPMLFLLHIIVLGSWIRMQYFSLFTKSVASYWPNILLCHFYVPDARLLRVLLWLSTKEEVMRCYACVVAEKDKEVCVVTNKHSVVGISFHHYWEINISWGMIYLTVVVLLLLFSQHENKTLLTVPAGHKLFFLHGDRHVSCKCHSCASISLLPSLVRHVLRVCTGIAIEHNYGVSVVMLYMFSVQMEDPRDHGMRWVNAPPSTTYRLPSPGTSAGTSCPIRRHMASARAGLCASRTKIY